MRAHDPNVFSREDPIKVEGLMKKFGNFTAVKDLTFSIR
jgi:ABC-type branched-subunit amino acid transport system ATPase component